jgi:NADPH:quinone reductase-like Zn-dependent oxidoreductase
MSIEHSNTAMGGFVDGILREYDEQASVSIPDSLPYRESATLPCAALTAWYTLYGGRRPMKPGDTILVQRTSGVSLFALQHALAGGAEVIPTTSDARKEVMLKGLGAHHVINYKEVPDWEQVAKKLSMD